jgi:hypothetical protein
MNVERPHHQPNVHEPMHGSNEEEDFGNDRLKLQDFRKITDHFIRGIWSIYPISTTHKKKNELERCQRVTSGTSDWEDFWAYSVEILVAFFNVFLDKRSTCQRQNTGGN